MSVRWRPLLSTHSPASVSGSSASLVTACWEKLLPLLPWCSVSNPPLSLVSFHTPCSLEISSEDEVLQLGTLIPMNTEVPTKYPLSQERIVVFEVRLHSKSLILYRPAFHGNWNALSLTRRRLKDKFPTSMVPLTAGLPNRQVFLPDPVYYPAQHRA